MPKDAKTNGKAESKTNGEEMRGVLRRAWNYFRGDGIVPWILQLLVAFVIIKFVLFPVLGLIFGSQLPVVAVMSGSMEHDAKDGFICGKLAPTGYKGSFDEYWEVCGDWYEKRGIEKDNFTDFSFKNGFSRGDIMVIIGPSRSVMEVGDVIVYEAQERYPIIHRVVNLRENGTVYETKGDFNGEQITNYVINDMTGTSSCHKDGRPVPCVTGIRVTSNTPGAVAILDETEISQERVIGKAVLRIPYLGWVKIGFSTLLGWVMGG